MVTRGTFVDFLQLRGEIRPTRSVVLSAPSSGSDLQIVALVKNGARVSAGDVVVEFDPTVQQRTLETKRSELKQAESEIERTGAELTRRVQAARSELEKHARRCSAPGSTCRPTSCGRASRPRNSSSRCRTPRRMSASSNRRSKASAWQRPPTWRSRGRSARRRCYDVRETERIIGALTIRAPAGGSISLLPNFRAGGPFSRAAPEFKRGDRAWAGAPIAELPDVSAVKMTARVDEFDRGRVQPGARCGCGSTRCRIAS